MLFIIFPFDIVTVTFPALTLQSLFVLFFCEHAVSPTLSGNEVDWVNAVCLSWMYKVQQYELTGLNK